jgi:magnesium transporter
LKQRAIDLLTANNNQKKTPRMFLFLSELLNRKVFDSQGRKLGKLVDLRIKLGELFPPVVSIRVRTKPGGRPVSFPWDVVEHFVGGEIRFKKGAENQKVSLNLEAGEVLLRDEILDDQVLDTHGARVERVNDLHLLVAEGRLRVSSAVWVGPDRWMS